MRIRRAEVARLAQIAISDPLTGLRNHRAFQEDLARELQRVSRSGDPLSLVLLDLDGLKAVNDRFGHQAGDERLQAVAEAIRAAQRASDLAYRIGGDEYAVILAGSRALGALEFAQRLRGLVAVTAGIAEATELRSRDDADPRGRPRADRRQAHPPARRDLRPRPESADAPSTSTTSARWPARSPSPSTPRTPTRAATARRCRSCAR